MDIEDLLSGLPVKSRQQHYLFAHRLLPAYARQHPERVFVFLSSEEVSSTFLHNLWSAAGEGLPESEKVEPEGLSSFARRQGDYVVTVVTLPKPIAITEAHFTALIFGPISGVTEANLHEIPFRYFALEYGISFTEEHKTILTEWTEDGSHLNFGEGPEPELEQFINAAYSMMVRE